MCRSNLELACWHRALIIGLVTSVFCEQPCKIEFQRKLELFLMEDRTEVLKSSADGKLVCGILPRFTGNSIDWDHTSCVDNNTIVFHYFPDRFKDEGYFWDDQDLGILSLACISSSPIDFDFFGQKPQPGIQVVKYFNLQQQAVNLGRFVLTVSIPYESDKTGNYSFYNVHNPDSREWIYIYFERAFGPYLLEDERVQEARMSEEDPNILILPCRQTNFVSENPAEMYKILENNTYQKLDTGEKLMYQPNLGFLIDMKETDNPWGNYVCTTDYPKMFDSIAIIAVNTDDFQSQSTPKQIGQVYFNEGLPTCKQGEGSQQLDYISNIYTRNPTQSRLVWKCLLKDYKCQMTSYDRNRAEMSGRLTNGYRSFCDQSDPNASCGLTNIYPSGLIMCHNSDGFAVEEYFMGMDDKYYLSSNWENRTIDTMAKLELAEYGDKGENFLYSGQFYLFKCSAVSFMFLPSYHWQLRLKNDSVVDAEAEFWRRGRDKDKNGNYRQSLGVELSSEVVEVICGFFPWTSSKLEQIGMEVTIRDRVPPKITSGSTNFTFRSTDETPIILCSARGIPFPTLSWWTDAREIYTGTLAYTKNQESYLQLDLSKLDQLAGSYLCVANNSEGHVTQTYQVQIEDLGKRNQVFVIVSVALVCSFALLFGLFVILWHRQRHQTLLTKDELDKFRNGIVDGDDNEYESIPNGCFALMPYNHEFEIRKEDFEIYKSSVLGSGEFGLVLKGVVRGTEVAVKTLKPHSDKSYLLALLSELKILIYIEQHENVIHLVGADTSGLQKGNVFVFVEYCPLGSLESFLRKNQGRFCADKSLKFDPLSCQNIQNIRHPNYQNWAEQDLNEMSLLSWSYQIARGMNYLSQKNVIHGDLATRNVLLKDIGHIKITDFGLSRQLYNYSVYKKTNQQPLPWRWLALESLKRMEFSIQTDVWAFGITVWEVFALGTVPYAGLEWSLNFVEQLDNGLRLSRPQFATDHVFGVLLNCWDINPENRPGFLELQILFQMELEKIKSSDYTVLSTKAGQ